MTLVLGTELLLATGALLPAKEVHRGLSVAHDGQCVQPIQQAMLLLWLRLTCLLQLLQHQLAHCFFFCFWQVGRAAGPHAQERR